MTGTSAWWSITISFIHPGHQHSKLCITSSNKFDFAHHAPQWLQIFTLQYHHVKNKPKKHIFELSWYAETPILIATVYPDGERSQILSIQIDYVPNLITTLELAFPILAGGAV